MDISDKQRGARLESLRNSKRMSQIELAKLLGYKSDSTISKWENGASVPSGGKLVELAKALETTTDYILFGNSNAILGDNNGVNGLSAGTGNTNTYNFGGNTTKQDNHNDTMKSLGTADLRNQRTMLNKIEKQLDTLNSIDKKMDIIIELLQNKGESL